MIIPTAQQRSELRCPVCGALDTAVVRRYRTGQTTSLIPFADLSIRSCGECRAAFASPLPEEKALEAFYAASYRTERGQSAPRPDAWDGGSVRARAQVDFVMKHVKSVRSWLDIGAGHGLLLDEARRRHIARTGAIEPDIHCAGQIQEAGHQLYGDLSDVQSSWDVISCSHVLEHLTNPRQFLKDVQGHLSEQGHVFCEVPNETHLSESPRDLPHLLFFTESTLIRLFRESGLRIIAVSSCGREMPCNRWGTILTERLRRASQKLFSRPPCWIDRFIYPHFHYHDDLSIGAWLRLLARKV